MCGISGLWKLDGAPVAQAEVEAMNRLLRHRGPDGSGVHLDGALGLGHTRLVILDTSTSGHQPMSYGDGRWWVSYNGEIYNFLELRAELEALGHRFKSDCDTEVLLAAYVAWGESCQLRLNGMWAFAIWDGQERTLFLSRDRFGVKPLFWYFDGRRFAFASEMKAFLGLPWFEPRLDESAVSSALMHMIPFEGTEHCLLAGVKRFRPGCSMIVRAEQEPQYTRWWRTLDHLEDPPLHLERQVERFRELLFDACRLRMRSDVALATCLSGGLDSSAVHSVVARLNSEHSAVLRRPGDWQTAFFAGRAEDEERAFAEDVVKNAGTKGIYKTLEPEEALGHLDDIIFSVEEITHLPVSRWLLYRELHRQGITVSLDGHGADELAAGYRHFPNYAMIEAVEQLRSLKSASDGMGSEGVDPRLTPVLEALPEFAPHDPLPKPTPVRDVLRAEPYPFEFANWAEDAEALSDRDRLTRHIYFEMHGGRLPWILREFDRTSMAHGVEVRAPFLDWRLVVYAFSPPIESKIREGYAKFILREALKGILPESVRLRKKKLGFPIIIYDWVKGPLKDYALDISGSDAFLHQQIWDGPRVRDVAERAIAEGNHHAIKIAWRFIHAARLSTLISERAAASRNTVSASPPAAAAS